jgi:putative ABC transport system ATP-binding protein
MMLPIDAQPGSALLAAHDLVKYFGPTPALRGVSLTIAAGEVVAITGPSGSGKSTLLHCLSGILLPDDGEVLYAGAQLDAQTDARRSELRRTEFGILFQFGQLVPELTAAENVALPLLLNGTRRGAALAAARAALDGLGVGELAAKRPGEMSGGQGQRVALARALVIAPRVVFADEPTGALDSLAGEQVLAGLVRLAKERGTTVVMVTHDAAVAAYADREFVMRDGLLEGGVAAGAQVTAGAVTGRWV